MGAKVSRCRRCGRRMRKKFHDWSFAVDLDADGYAEIAHATCPECTTTGENAEVSVNDALLQSERTADGRLRVWPIDAS